MTVNLNRVPMNPQPLLRFEQIKADSFGVWRHWEPGQWLEPLIGKPETAVGIALEDGIWIWLLND